MSKRLKYIPVTLILIVCIIFISSNVKSEIISKIDIVGNERVPPETIRMFSNVSLQDKINDNKINSILKNLYETNFFENVSVKLENNLLIITVKEYPIIENINIEGLKAKKIKEGIRKNLLLKNRSSFNKFFLEKDINTMSSSLKDLGYYFSTIDTFVENLENNKVNIIHKIKLGNKSKIHKISFIGDKIFKDSKLRNVILSEEYKFWKFISGRKYLKESNVNFDKRLLKNFYLNQGFYNAEINSSFAKLDENNNFELTFNVFEGEKFFFDNFDLILPLDYDKNNY